MLYKIVYTYICMYAELIMYLASSVNVPYAFPFFRVEGMLSTGLQTVAVSALSST